MFRKVPLCLAFILLFGLITSQAWAAPLPQEPQPPAPPDPQARIEEKIPYLPGEPVDMPAAVQAPDGAWDRYVAQKYWEGSFDLTYGSDTSNQTEYYPSAQDIHPKFNRGCTQILFSSTRTDNQYDIYIKDMTSGISTRITSNNADEVYPIWSPDETRIAYQSYVDGQAEIYIMDANGANQARLTYWTGYDGEPSFSPDGSRIAFTSNRSGYYAIWTMSVDGSNPVLLTAGLSYSSRPAWSPDGSKIAFSTDGNNDGWLEVWKMDADGSNQALVKSRPDTQWDYWVNGWSPDGAYITATLIGFVYVDGQWYWRASYLYRIEPTLYGGSERIGYFGETSWNVDWKSLDVYTPTSSMNGLPPSSPYQFLVSWTGQDQGTGLLGYDVQYKDGLSGAWTDWLVNTGNSSATFTGVGGHTYYFRVRARDRVYNTEAWPVNPQASTAVDSNPPATYLASLPEFWQGEIIPITWGGVDPGDSGIAGYDIQYQDQATDWEWVNWLNNTTSTSADFTGVYGHTYTFRVRGRDYAQNLEPWGVSGNPHVTLYAWRLSGQVYDNAGTPIGGVLPELSPQPFLSISSDQNGNYAIYTTTNPDLKSASWSKPGYGNLPETRITSPADIVLDTYLPPADDILQDGGFESGSLAPAWQAGGTITQVLTSTAPHSGDYAALLGEARAFLPAGVVHDPATEAQASIDGSGTLHITVLGSVSSQEALYYLQRRADGTWLPAELVVQKTSLGDLSQALSADGTFHVIWASGGIFHRSRTPGGVWSAIETIATGSYYDPSLLIDADGTLHVAWLLTYPYGMRYAYRPEGGSWSSVETITPEQIDRFEMTANIPGQIDLLASNYYTQTYFSRETGGVWSDAQEVGDNIGCYFFDLFPQGRGSSEQIGLFLFNDNLLSARLSAAGTWSAPVNILPGMKIVSFTAAMDTQNTLHVVFADLNIYNFDSTIYYMKKESGGGWSVPYVVYQTNPNPSIMILSAGSGGHIMLAWSQVGMDEEGVFFMQLRNGQWSQAQRIFSSVPSGITALVVSPEGEPHILWTSTSLYYVTLAPAAATGPSQLSQTLTLTPSLEAPVLSFLYQMNGANPAAGSGFSVQVSDGISSTTLLSTTANSPDWQHAWFDLSPWLSQTITLTFQARQVQGYPAVAVYLDEVSLGSSYPDTWVQLMGSPVSAQPGQQVTLLLQYGNRGGALASGVGIDLTLPDGLTFLDASLPPSSTAGQALHWDVGDLPARGESGAITLTVEIDSAAPRAVDLEITAGITASRELETANNSAHFILFTGARLFMPIIQR